MVEAFAASIFGVFPDFAIRLTNQFAAGSWAGAEWTMSATYRGDLPGLPATGKGFSIRGATVFELRGGKIRRVSDYWDMATFLKQIGLPLGGIGSNSRQMWEGHGRQYNYMGSGGSRPITRRSSARRAPRSRCQSIFRGPATVPYGEPIPFETGFDKLGANVITITQPVILHVQVGRVGQHNALWEAVLPPLRGEIPPGTAFIRFKAIWNQRDATSRTVPRGGDYWAGVLLPATIEDATADLVRHQERLDKQRRGVVVHIQ